MMHRSGIFKQKSLMNNLFKTYRKFTPWVFLSLIPLHLEAFQQGYSRSLYEDYEAEMSDTAWFWDFNRWDENMGWTIPREVFGGILGGALWITIQPDSSLTDTPTWRQMVWGKDRPNDLLSPAGLEVDAKRFTKIRMRILNRSPETDGLVFWRSADNRDVTAGPVRFTMKPDADNWQEVTCHIDGQWKGTIDRIGIRPAQMWWRGDIWIDWIAILAGDPRPRDPRPDLIGDQVVPVVSIPGISQEGFRDAFRVLDECLVTDVPIHGFNYPFLAPGGIYGENWWQLDGSLNMAGAKWANQSLVEDMMKGFAEVQAQNPDGRIDLWGGSPVRGQVADVSSIPRYFEAAWDVARRTDDPLLQEQIYSTMKGYLGYWFSPAKLDQGTGLVTAVFEETFLPVDSDPGMVAAVDLNVAIAIGCHNTSMLARRLGYLSESREYALRFETLARNIDRTLWHPRRKVYLNYHVRDRIHLPSLYCSTFDPLQLGTLTQDRIDALLERLLDERYFNWGILPVTSLAKTDPGYVEARGQYDGRAWNGDVWTMRNMPIIKGLKKIGRHDLASELNWSTIRTFHKNYCEFVVPSTGSGEGVKRYGWSASQYIQAIIENLFGVDYDRLNKRLRILPGIPEALKGEKISLNNLIIPGEGPTVLSLTLEDSGQGELSIDLKIQGPLPQGSLEIFVPATDETGLEVQQIEGEEPSLIRHAEGLANIAGIMVPMQERVRISFQEY
jgi:hypothetical protein